MEFCVDDYADILGNYICTLHLERYFERIDDGKYTGSLIVWSGIKPAVIEQIVNKVAKAVERTIVFIPNSWRSGVYVYKYEDYISVLHSLKKV